MLEYEPYHVHTSYSNCLTQTDSTMFIEDYAKVYRERGHHVLCISEHGNRSNVWEQYELAKKYSDDTFKMTPLAAAETYFVPNRLEKDSRNFHLILVAKNMEGFYQLNEILSEAYLTGYYYRARVDFELLQRLNPRNFICTTACLAGVLRDENFETYCGQLHDIFRENFYLEVQHHQQDVQKVINGKAVALSKKNKWPLIYGTDSHYINKEDKILRTELIRSKGINYGDEDEFLLHLPTAEEAYEMLRNQCVLNRAQIEEAMENTLILREFEGVSFTTEKKIPNAYPDLTLEERNNLYKELCFKEYVSKAGTPTEEESKEIADEMNAVADTNTADYFLTAKKVVDKGIENGGVLTKTGRGSGSSFCTNYSLGFTSLNRLHSPVKLYPERFISRERMASGTLPDLDLNLTNVEAFEQAGKEILGEYGCLPMIAYGTAKTLSAFKLLAKARDIDFDTANAVSKQINTYELDVKHALENNQDDPDYNVDDDVDIEDYVDDQYINLINDSKQYKGIVVSWSPHPCAHLLLDRDIRREVGIVKIKDQYCAYIDGATADAYGYLKLDFLTVTVVKIISEAFKQIGLPMMTVDELLEKCKNDKEVWNLYARGFTQGLNQCEQPKSTERVMNFKPHNIVELAGFVGAIRPGFKSMLDTFITRTPFAYNIPSLDKLLQTKEMPSSFLLYDEQVLSVLIAAGIPAADAYKCLKAIKKKKADKVAPFKKLFKEGFSKHLQEDEGRTEQEAEKVCDQILKILEDSASYLFNASHALCVACDSLYVAWLKAHYPYELYLTMLKIWDEKKNKDKIANIISEMRRYRDIKLTPGRFRQDNRDWLVDKEKHVISQSLSSIRYMQKQAAEDLYKLGKQEEAVIGTNYYTDVLTKEAKARVSKIKKTLKPLQDKAQALLDSGVDQFDDKFLELYDEGYPLEQELKQIYADDDSYESRAHEETVTAKLDCFTNVLRAIQMNTRLDTRQIEILIQLNYFEEFGKPGKLMKVFNYFFDGEKKLTKTIKSFEERLEACRAYEASLEDSDLEIGLRLRSEFENVGLCITSIPDGPHIYFVEEIDERYTIKVKLYNVQKGTTTVVKIAKKDYRTMGVGSCIVISKADKRQRYSYKNGVRTAISGETDFWVTNYKVLKKGEAA